MSRILQGDNIDIINITLVQGKQLADEWFGDAVPAIIHDEIQSVIDNNDISSVEDKIYIFLIMLLCCKPFLDLLKSKALHQEDNNRLDRFITNIGPSFNQFLCFQSTALPDQTPTPQNLKFQSYHDIVSYAINLYFTM